MKLLSRDIRVTVHSKDKKRRIEGEQEQVQKLQLQVIVAQPVFRVLVHGVQTRQDLKQAKTRAKIQDQNLQQHPNLQVRQAVWLKSEKAIEGQRYSSAILAVQNEAQVREVIAKGLVLEGTLLSAEVYYLQQRVVQCFTCNQFRHTSAYCKESKTICGICSGLYRTSKCESSTCKCSNCKGSHASWSKACKVKQAAIAKTRSFYASF